MTLVSSTLEPPRHVSAPRSPWAPYDRYIRPYLWYVLLTASLVAAMAHQQTGGHRLWTFAIAAGAGLWLLLTETLPPERVRDNAWVVALSFAGHLSAAVVLMERDLVFLVFMVGCFFHALRLRPVPLAVLGLLATSLFINTIGSGGPLQALRDEGFVFVVVVLVQTGAIAGGAMAASKVAKQNEARRRMLEELEAAQAENAGLHRQLLTQAREQGVVDERQRLSREIHDTLAQGFTGIITQLEAAEHASDWRRHVGTALGLARENLDEARRSVRALRPEALERDALGDALREVTRRWSERSAVPVEFTATGDSRPLHPEVEATLLRLTQEALSNVAKHAAAGRVGVTLSYMENQVTLDVRDDGKGFDPAAANDGFGLPGMRQRAHRMLGSFEVESEPGCGTAVSASLPAVAES